MKEGLEEYSVSNGEPLHVWLSITGHPFPKITWAFNAKVLKDEDINLMSGGNKYLLSIAETARKHQGIYTITAVNEAGEDAKDVPVNVYGKYKGHRSGCAS